MHEIIEHKNKSVPVIIKAINNKEAVQELFIHSNILIKEYSSITKAQIQSRVNKWNDTPLL